MSEDKTEDVILDELIDTFIKMCKESHRAYGDEYEHTPFRKWIQMHKMESWK